MYKLTKQFSIILLILGLARCGGGENPQPKSDFGRDVKTDMQYADVQQPKDMGVDTRSNKDLGEDVNRDTDLSDGRDANLDMIVLGPRPVNAPRFPRTFIDLYGDIVNHQNTDPSNFTPERLTIVDGKVLEDQGDPLVDVKIYAPDFPDIGYVLSDMDGNFSFALNGGGVVNLRYTKIGFIDSERRVQSLWNEFVHIGPLVLKEYSQTVTTISFSNANQIQVARGDVETDYAGTRQATLLINSGTKASLRLKDGTTVDMPSLNLRFTEFTVGAAGPLAMPGSLPGSSAYTYAVEISADEAVAMDAVSVEFDKPVYFYVDDFIGFPVGTVVPIGYYDREKHAWIPNDNGKVISIVSVANGKATVDIDGDGIADTGTALINLGFTDDELNQLASLYIPGKVLWRGPMTHLTPWDCNWPYGPPPDAEIAKKFKNPKKPGDDDCEEPGSIIECESGILRESIVLPGTPHTMNYNSYDFQFDAAYQIQIPILPDTIPASMDCALVSIEIAGNKYYHSLNKEEVNKVGATKVFNFEWDGKDRNGNLVQGTKKYKATLQYLYKPYYYDTDFAVTRSFGAASWGDRSGTSGNVITRYRDVNQPPEIFTGEPCRGELIGVSTFSKGRLGRYVRGKDLGGWTLDAHHAYDTSSSTIHLGNGSRFSQNPVGLTISAGNGLLGTPSDGGRSLNEPIRPARMGIKSDGTIIIDDSFYFNGSRLGLKNYFEHRPDGTVHRSSDLIFPGTPGVLYFDRMVVASDDSLFFTGRVSNNDFNIRSIFREESGGGGGLEKIVHPSAGAVRLPRLTKGQ